MDNITKEMNQFADENFGEKADQVIKDKNRDSLVNQTSEILLRDLGEYGIDDLELIDATLKAVAATEETKEEQPPIVVLTFKSPKFEGVVNATIKKLSVENLVEVVAYDDKEIRDAYGIDNFLVNIPDKGRYVVEAINEEVALDRAIVTAYEAGEIQDFMVQRTLPDLKANLLKEGKVQRITKTAEPEEEERIVGKPVTVVYEELPPARTPHVTIEEKAPAWAQPSIDEMEKYLGEEMDQSIDDSIKNQAIEDIQYVIDDLAIPAVAEEATYELKEDGNVEGSVKITSDKIDGNFLFTANLDNNILTNVEPELDILKGMYDMKKIEVIIGDRTFETDAPDEKTAVRKVLDTLTVMNEDLALEGHKISSLDFDEVADKLAETQTKIVDVYQTPDAVDLGTSYQLIEKDGKKYFTKKE